MESTIRSKEEREENQKRQEKLAEERRKKELEDKIIHEKYEKQFSFKNLDLKKKFLERTVLYNVCKDSYNMISKSTFINIKKMHNETFKKVKKPINQLNHSKELINVNSKNIHLLLYENKDDSTVYSYLVYFICETLFESSSSWNSHVFQITIVYFILSLKTEHKLIVDCFLGMMADRFPYIIFNDDESLTELKIKQYSDYSSIYFYLLLPQCYNKLEGVGLDEAWMWITEFVNRFKNNFSKSIILTSILARFFEICHISFNKYYGKQYIKLHNLVNNQILPIITKKGASSNSYTVQLKTALNNPKGEKEFYDSMYLPDRYYENPGENENGREDGYLHSS